MRLGGLDLIYIVAGYSMRSFLLPNGRLLLRKWGPSNSHARLHTQSMNNALDGEREE